VSSLDTRHKRRKRTERNSRDILLVDLALQFLDVCGLTTLLPLGLAVVQRSEAQLRGDSILEGLLLSQKMAMQVHKVRSRYRLIHVRSARPAAALQKEFKCPRVSSQPSFIHYVIQLKIHPLVTPISAVSVPAQERN